MNAVAIGPLAFDAERLAAIAGLVAFLALTSFLAWRVDDRLARWSTWTAFAGVAGARAVHVVQHIDGFFFEPWRIFALWQGGFSWAGGAAAVAAMIVILFVRDRQLFAWGAASVIAGVTITGVTAFLTLSRTDVSPLGVTLPNLTGDQVAVGGEGRPIVLNLWATWCPPCRRELPMMAEIAEAATEVDFLFANQGEQTAQVDTYLRRQGLMLREVVLDPQLMLSRHYSAVGLPATLFLAEDGTVVASHLGEISREVLIEKIEHLTDREGNLQ